MTKIYIREDEEQDEADANGHCPTCGQPIVEPLDESRLAS